MRFHDSLTRADPDFFSLVTRKLIRSAALPGQGSCDDHRRMAASYMLLSIIGELRIGTSPRPIMAARLIVPRKTLAETGWSGPAAPDVAAS